MNFQRFEIHDVAHKHRHRNGKWMLSEDGVKQQEKIEKLTLAVTFVLLVADGSDLTEYEKLIISRIKAEL